MELVSVNGVQIDKSVKEALDRLNARIKELQFNTQLTVQLNGGYMSKYEVAQELLKFVDPKLIQDKTKKDIVTKAKESTDEFTKIASNQSQFDTLENVLNNLDVGFYKAGGSNILTQQQADRNHKHITSGILYGIPNKTTLDPRRTGKVVVFNNISRELYTKLIKEGPSYGFVWYGPKDLNIWMYVGDAAKSIVVL